ncbi:carbohydrate ABC transporter permease [Jiangella mangrovi]|uniref:ABC-type glycerol-3-phosphate transport system permease component n=1 Tax=Jiangella mangrovi TaxID=1524084 RepID=A0A7W9GPA5_9ACTN|nr:carbohydrate ABC transporter permease [Jiangella mangrovi]MBB5787515.1 ABC-type glycerol-3-phosphate transport system permease component [Jiangella mangrovi]
MSAGVMERTASPSRPVSRKRRPVGKVVVFVLLLAGGLVFASVFLYAALSAVKPADEILASPMRWLPSQWLWGNFALPFEQAPFARYYLNSTVVGVSVTVLNVVTCTLAGYSFSKFAYRGRNVLFLVVLATLMVPLEVIYVPLYALVFDLGWVNSFAGLIVPSATSAFGIFLMRQSIEGLPDELLEAARIDGAGELRILWHVVAPMMVSPMAALALFIFMTNWDSHLWPLLVGNDADHQTLPVGLAAMQANNLGSGGIPMMMAAALLALLPTLLLFLVLQRKFVEGITMTAGIK